jgi:hypothetical protein
MPVPHTQEAPSSARHRRVHSHDGVLRLDLTGLESDTEPPHTRLNTIMHSPLPSPAAGNSQTWEDAGLERNSAVFQHDAFAEAASPVGGGGSPHTRTKSPTTPASPSHLSHCPLRSRLLITCPLYLPPPTASPFPPLIPFCVSPGGGGGGGWKAKGEVRATERLYDDTADSSSGGGGGGGGEEEAPWDEAAHVDDAAMVALSDALTRDVQRSFPKGSAGALRRLSEEVRPHTTTTVGVCVALRTRLCESVTRVLDRSRPVPKCP